MLKSEIEDKLNEEFKLDKNISKKVVDSLISSFIDTLKNDDRIEIRGFGSFFSKSYKSYKGRNPKTGEHISVPDKKLPIFRPSKDLVARLNKIKD